jgi:hypothetical protein
MSNNQKLRDFTNVIEKDCVRLIIAQDLKEFGIDVDANLGGGLGNLSTSNSNYHGHTNYGNNKSTSHYHHHHTNNNHHHNNSLNTHHHHHQQQQQHTFSLFNQSSNKHHNKSNISTNLMSDLNSNTYNCSCNRNTSNQHDCQLSSSISPIGSKRVFGIHLKQIEQTEVILNEQILIVPRYYINFFFFAYQLINNSI